LTLCTTDGLAPVLLKYTILNLHFCRVFYSARLVWSGQLFSNRANVEKERLRPFRRDTPSIIGCNLDYCWQ